MSMDLKRANHIIELINDEKHDLNMLKCNDLKYFFINKKCHKYSYEPSVKDLIQLYLTGDEKPLKNKLISQYEIEIGQSTRLVLDIRNQYTRMEEFVKGLKLKTIDKL